MKTRVLGTRLAIPCLAVGLILAGCSDDDPVATGTSSIGSTSDINPHDPSDLRDGGNLRLPISGFPATFNVHHVDSDGDVSAVMEWTMAHTITGDAAGVLTLDKNYFTEMELISTEPQQIRYTINPKAVWSDGSPITWEDLRAQAEALSGRNPEFLVSYTQGYSRVDRVERGADDRQAIVTFGKHYSEWRGLFNPLSPKEAMATPEAFNNLEREAPLKTAGPFIVSSIDRPQQRIVLSRNPKWWGDTPKLDTVTFSVLDSSALLAALQNNELDATAVTGIDEVKTAMSAPGVVVRRASKPSTSHFIFNGAPGSIVEDPKLRQALTKAIDRQGVVTAVQNGTVENPKPLNNHIYMDGQKGYQDNAASISYDPDEAARMLDELGWKLNGDVREKDGRQLVIRDVMYQWDTWVQMAQIMQQNLARVGVKLVIETYPGNRLFNDIIDPGNFDIAQFVWGRSIFPLGALPQIYAWDPANPQSNKGKIGSPELNALIEETISELDPDKAIELANKADRMIFELGHTVPFFQSAGTTAVRENLANFGAFGLADIEYTKVGFLK